MSFSPPSFTAYNLQTPLLSLVRVLEMAAAGAGVFAAWGIFQGAQEGGAWSFTSKGNYADEGPLLLPPCLTSLTNQWMVTSMTLVLEKSS